MLRQKISVLLAAVLLAGCGDPLREVARIDEVALPEGPAEEAVLAAREADDRPLLARIFAGRRPAPEANDAPEEDAGSPAKASGGISKAEQDAAAAPRAPKRRGVLGWFTRQSDERTTRTELPGAENIAPGDGEASRAPERTRRAEEEAGSGIFGGLFGKRKAARLTGPEADEVAPGTQLAFGEIAGVCAISHRELGRQVARSGGGKGKYRLHDSAPGSTAMRPFYITGFDDGCPRTVTAALAIFGSASHYEALRESGAKKGRDKGAADKAYDKARRKLCGARIGKDCGAMAGELETETAFLTVYDRFGTARNWRDILLHDGAVLAMDES